MFKEIKKEIVIAIIIATLFGLFGFIFWNFCGPTSINDLKGKYNHQQNMFSVLYESCNDPLIKNQILMNKAIHSEIGEKYLSQLKSSGYYSGRDKRIYEYATNTLDSLYNVTETMCH